MSEDNDWQAFSEDPSLLLALTPDERRRVKYILKHWRPPDHPQRSFYSFLGCLFTIDEAKAGEVAPWPFDHNTEADPSGRRWDPYWKDWETVLLESQILLVDKNRRTMATNTMAAFDLWIASGGQDSRWPALTRSTKNRRVLIQGRKLEGVAGSAEFLDRVRQLCEEALRQGKLKREWTDFPKWTWNKESATNSIGGKIDAVPQGADQWRGPGVTLGHGEEISAWEQAEASVSTAVATLAAGGKSDPGMQGHFVAVGTPAYPSYAEKIRSGDVPSRGAPPIRPKTAYVPVHIRGDWLVFDVDGAKHVPFWQAEIVGRGMPEQMYRRECLKDWSAVMGKAAYPEFGEGHQAVEPLPFYPDLPLVLGWDQGGTTAGGNPACVVTQVSPRGQWFLYGSICPREEEVVGAWEFGEMVADYLEQEFAKPAGIALEKLTLIHYGDPAGNVKPPDTRTTTNTKREMRSMYEILRRGDRVVAGYDRRGDPIWEEKQGRGWKVQSGEVTLTKRMEAMRARLTTMLPGGLAALVVDPNANDIRKSLSGGYHFHQRSDGRFELDPAHNRDRDIGSAAEYACSKLFTARPQREAQFGERSRAPYAGRASSVRL